MHLTRKLSIALSEGHVKAAAQHATLCDASSDKPLASAEDVAQILQLLVPAFFQTTIPSSLTSRQVLLHLLKTMIAHPPSCTVLQSVFTMKQWTKATDIPLYLKPLQHLQRSSLFELICFLSQKTENVVDDLHLDVMEWLLTLLATSLAQDNSQLFLSHFLSQRDALIKWVNQLSIITFDMLSHNEWSCGSAAFALLQHLETTKLLSSYDLYQAVQTVYVDKPLDLISAFIANLPAGSLSRNICHYHVVCHAHVPRDIKHLTAASIDLVKFRDFYAKLKPMSSSDQDLWALMLLGLLCSRKPDRFTDLELVESVKTAFLPHPTIYHFLDMMSESIRSSNIIE